MYWGRIILNADSLPTSIYVCRGKRDMNGERLIDFENKNPDVQI
jgi:hypothetical protein